MTKNGIHAWNVNTEWIHKPLPKRTNTVSKNLGIGIALRFINRFIVLYSWREMEGTGNVEFKKCKLRCDMIVLFKNLSRGHIEKGQDLFSVFTKTRIWF